MKKLVALTLLAFSGIAAAQDCRVELVQVSNPRGTPLKTYLPIRGDYECSQALRACVIDRDASRNRANLACKTVRGSRDPIPPRYPDPIPPHQDDYQVQREIRPGEEAFSLRDGKWVRVMGLSRAGYMTETMDNWRSRNTVSRSDLAITNACTPSFCTNDMAYDVSQNKDVRLLAVDVSGRFVTETTDNWRTINSRRDESDLAHLSGCIGEVCVNDTVYNIERQIRREVVYAIGQRGLVTKSDDSWRHISVNVNAENLALTRGCTYQGRINLCVGDYVRQARDVRSSKLLGLTRRNQAVIESNDSWRTLSVVNGNDLYPAR